MQELEQQEIPTLEGEYLPTGNTREKIFITTEDKSAYSQMLEYINWMKPVQFSVVSGNMQDGKEGAKLTYVR